MEQIMLPPVGAGLSASADHQDTSRPTMRPSPAVPSGSPVATRPLPADLLGGGRIDTLSLSGQVQMAQGLSILAETVGTLLKISRREGESLEDYTRRLADALKSLSPSQRAAVEQSIAQLARGITLRVLIDILNNPAGPEAARLTASLEGPPAAGRDAAARAVVSSYRQNDAAAASSGAPVQRTAISGPAAGDAAGPVAAKTVAGELAAIPPASGRGEATPSPPTAAPPPLPATTGSASPAGRVAVPAPEPRTALLATQDPAPATTRGMAPPGPASDAASGQGSLPAGPDDLQPEEAGGSRSPAAANPAASRPDAALQPPSARRATAGAPAIYDGPALARLAHQVVADSKSRLLQDVLFQGPASASQSGEAASTGRVSGLPALPPSGGDQPVAESAAQPVRPPAGASLPGQGETALARPADLQGIPAGDAQPSGSRAVAQMVAIAQPLADPAAFILAAPMLAREGLAQVLVTYPPAPEAPEEEERDVERLSAIDDEGDGRSSQQDAQGKDEDPADGAPGDEGGDEGEGQGDPSLDNAQDLYRRMADLT